MTNNYIFFVECMNFQSDSDKQRTSFVKLTAIQYINNNVILPE